MPNALSNSDKLWKSYITKITQLSTSANMAGVLKGSIENCHLNRIAWLTAVLFLNFFLTG